MNLQLSRRVLVEVLVEVTDLGDALGSGEIIIEGDAGVLADVFGLLEEPDFQFNVVTP